MTIYIKHIKLLLVIVSIILATSCDFFTRSGDDEIVAKAFGNNLYLSDLEDIVPGNSSTSDSINIIQQYVDNWIRKQIFLDHAEKKIDPEHMDFDKKVQDYRNSLIIYAFENNNLRENLDTVVSNQQINDYYQDHIDEFKLTENIVQVTYVKVPLDAPNQNLPRRLSRSNNEDDLAELDEYCNQNAATYFIDLDTWLLFNEILREIPIQTSNQENYLRNNRYAEISDDYYRYFLYIHDYKLKDSTSPVTFVTDRIKKIILNHRKHEYIKNLRNELYRNAVRSNSFEIFI